MEEKPKSPGIVYDIKDLPSSTDPFVVFRAWVKEAEGLPGPMVTRPNAVQVSLATCSKEGQPSVRTVELNILNDRDLVFITYSNSRKGKDMEENPLVAASYSCSPLGRAVRIEGRVEKLPQKQTEAMFYSAARDVQVMLAVYPHQSTVVANRSELEEERAAFKEKYKDPLSVIPCPANMATYNIQPSSFEFYQGHPPPDLELADRFLFTREEGDTWKVDRLVP
jgi:pyridoxamine 5'-phosphate oxidase